MKRMKRRLFGNAVLAALALLFISTTVSCEVGLGASVDVDRPTTEILYPPRNAVIRDSFVLSGTALDDKGIDYVKVTLTNVSSGNKETFNYSIPQNGALQTTWSINLNEKLSYNEDLDVATWLFPDGNYSIDAETIDLEGKSSGVSSITVSIDNTAPFFIASKPGSKLYKNPSKYGANLRVTGTVAEDHDLAKMEMKVFNIDTTNGEKKDSNPISVANGLIEEDVATAGGVKVTFANFNAALGDTYKSRYDALYGENSDPAANPSITFITEIELTDSARLYKNPSDKEGVASGNTTKQFYLTDDLLPLTGNGKDRSGNDRLGLNAGEIKAVANKTSNIADTTKINTIIDTLKEKKRSTAYFSLNPNNNPTYNIGSSAFEDTVSDITTISPTANKGISLSVQFAAGRDEIEVVASSTALYLVGPVSSEDYPELKSKIFDSTQWLGNPVITRKTLGTESYVDYAYPAPVIPPEFSSKGVGITKLPNTKMRLDPFDPEYDPTAADYRLDGKATGLNYSYKIESISSGFYYFLVGVGEDADGTPIQPADGYYYGFKGTSSGLPPTIAIDAFSSDNNNNYKNLENSTNTNLSGSDTEVANRKIVFTGVSTGGDGVVDKVLYNLTIKGGETDIPLLNQVATEVDFSGENKKWKVELPVSRYVNDGEVRTFEFTFWTVNKGAGADAAKSSDAYRSITVDLQKPTVAFSGITPVVEYDGNKCVNGIVKVDVSASDKTRLTSWGYKILVEGEQDPVEDQTITDLTVGSFSFDTNAYNNKKFEIILTAHDDAGNEAISASSNNYKLAAGESYVINQDSDKPVIDVSGSIESTTKTDIVEKSKVNLFTVAGKTAGSIAVNVVDDDNNGVKEITVKYKKWNGSAFASTSTIMYSDASFAAQEVNKNIDLVLDDTPAGKQKPMEPGIYEVTIIAKDEHGAESVPCTFVIGVTSGAPSIRVTSQANQWLSAGKEITIEGEKVNGSVQKITRTYVLKNTSGASITIPTGSSTANATLTPVNDKFTDKIKIADFQKTGTVVVSYTAKDEYGQQSEPVTFEYKIDGNKPTVSASYKWDNGSTPTTAYSKINKIKLTPTVKDGTGESGMASTAYALVSSDTRPGVDSSDWVVFTDTTRTITVPDGISYIFVRALDNAGNDNYTTAQALYVDNAKPELTVTTPDSYTNGSDISIPVSIVDAAGLNATAAINVLVKGAKKETPDNIETVLDTNIPSSSFTKTNSTYAYTYKLLKATVQNLAEGSFSVTITAKDLGGNTAAETFTMVYDVVGPLVEVTSPAAGEWITSSEVTVNGTCTDESTVSAVWYKQAASATLPTGAKLTDSTWTKAGWKKATGTTSWNFKVSNIADGSLKFFIAAVDSHGNVRTDVKTHSINKDTGKPTITLTKYGKNATTPATDVPSGDIPLNVKTFSLNGAYSDNASSVTITAKRKLGAAAAEDVPASSITKTPANATALNGTWTIKEATALAEGTYVYTITATDQTGKSAVVTKTVIVDTTAPVYSSMKVNGYPYAARWSGDPSSSLNGTWTESGSGVDHFEYWQKANATAPTGTELNNPTGKLNPTENGNDWSFTQNFNFNDGVNYFFIRAVDKAGNESRLEPFSFNVDTTAPTLTVTKTGSGDGYTWDNNKLYVTKDLVNADNLKLELNIKEASGFYLNTYGMAAVFTKEVIPNEKGADGKAKAYLWDVDSVGTVEGMVGFKNSLDPSNIKKKDPTTTEATGNITVKNLSDGENTIYVYGMDFVYNYAQEAIQVYVDKDAPTVVYDTTKLIKNASSNYNVNGIVEVTGTADDDDKVASTEISVYKKTDVTLTSGKVAIASDKTAVTATGLFPTVTGNTERKWTYKVDTTKLTDNSDYVIVLTVKDRAGNKALYGQEIHVNQATDKPVINESNFAWDAIDTAYNGSNKGIHEGFNLFEKSGNNKIMAFIEDDDAVSKVTAEYSTNKTSWTTFFEKTDINSPTYSMSAPLVTSKNGTTPLGNGKWYIRITAYDNNATPVSNTSPSFLIAIDSDSPTFTVTEVDGKTYAANMDVVDGKNIVFTVKDDTEPSKVEYSTNGGTNWTSTDITSSGTGAEKTFTHTGATGSSSGKVTYLYRATDIFNRTTTKTVTFVVDKTEPTATPAGNVTVAYAGAESAVAYNDLSSAWINKSSVEVKGATGVVTDAEGKLSTSATVTVSGATSGTTPLELNENLSFADERSLEDGKSTINYAFTDKAGHPVDFDVTVKVDTTAPVISAGTAKIKAGATELSASSVIKANAVTVSFTAEDAFGGPSTTPDANKVVSKLLKAEIGKGYKFETPLETLDWSSTEPESQVVTDQSIDISAFPDGETELYVRLYDNAGNESQDISLGKFIIDRTPPKVDYDGIRAGATVYKTISFTAKCTDNNLDSDAKPVVKVGSTTIYDGTDSTIGMTATQNETTKVWTFANIDTTKSAFTDNADNTFQVIFTDKAGNSSTETLTVKVDQDADRPVIVFDNLDPTTKTTVTSNRISGSISDNEGISYFGYRYGTSGAYTEITITNGNWYFTDDTKSAESNYTLCFKVTAGGTTFETVTGANVLTTPKMRLSGSITSTGEPFDFAIDKTPPVIDNTVYIAISEDNGSSYGEFKNFANSTWYGGKKSKAKFRFNVTDNIKTTYGELDVKVKFQDQDDADAVPATWHTSTGDNDPAGYECEVTFPSTMGTGAESESTLYLIHILAKDDTVNPSRKTLNVSIDNSGAHKLSNTTPASSLTVTGDVALKGYVRDEKLYSGLSKMEYLVPEYTEADKTAGTADPVLPADKSTGSAFTWLSEYDSANTSSPLSRSSTSWTLALNNLQTDGNINADYAGYFDTATQAYLIPVWFRFTDEVGNYSYDKHVIKYDPDADKPSLEITSPEEKYDATNSMSYVTLGGEIRIMGTASDNEGVDAIYVQYDVNGDGQFNDTDKAWLNRNGYTVVDLSTIATNLADENAESKWGVKATGSYNWQARFNAGRLATDTVTKDISLEVGADANTGKKTLNIRCRALDNDTSGVLASGWSNIIHVSVNNLIPEFSEFKLNRYSTSAGTGTPLESITYDPDMYISGSNWFLEGTVKDESTFAMLKVGNKTVWDGTIFTDTAGVTKNSDNKSFTFKFPISGTKYENTIYVLDNDADTAGGQKENDVSFTINIDSTAPAFVNKTNAASSLEVFQNEYGTDANKLTDRVFLKNSNGSLVTISSKVSETGSGFKTAAIYLKRPGSKGKAYNVYKSESTSTGYGADIDAASEPNSNAVDKVFYKDNMPVLKKSATPTAVNKFTVTGIGSNNFVRESSLVYINGGYRTIMDIEGNEITLDSNVVPFDAEAQTQTAVDVYFVYAMTVNNKGETHDKTTFVLKNDDGDGLEETYSTSGPYTTWEATFDSSKIPDGDVEIHVVVFDRAGNMVHGKVDTRISNNPPRIARVTLATEFNGVEGYQDVEMQKYYALSETAEQKADDATAGVKIWNLDTTIASTDKPAGELWTMKNGLSIIPEIVGGNGEKFYYRAEKLTTYADATALSGATALTTAEQTSNTFTNKGTVTLDNSKIVKPTDTTTGENGVVAYKFSIWDETEGQTPGKGYEGTVLNLKVKQDIVDSEKPVTVVDKFYWNDNTNNSLYGNSSNNGHIELEADVIRAQSMTGYPSGSLTSGAPKVSGKITIRGSAYDNHRLSELYISAGTDFAFTGTGVTVSNNTSKVATFTNNAWNIGVGDATGIGDFATNGWHFKITKNELTQHGHYVEWQLDWDTQKMTAKTKKGLVFTMTAKDAATSANTTSTANGDLSNGTEETDTTANHGRNRPTYTMDVVPYIKAVKTSLSGTYAAQKASVYNRTALGNYPVRTPVKNRSAKNTTNHINDVDLTTTAETVMLYGFNLNHNKKAVTGGGTVTSAAKTSGDTYVSYDCETASFSVANLASGNLVMTVNDVPVINNYNINDAKGTATANLTTYTNANKYGYNRQPNNSNNNNLTDDVVFDVWEFNDKAALPLNGLLGGVKMQINPVNNMIQYAFSNGSQYLSMGGKARSGNYGTTSGSSYSAKYWSMNWDTYSAISVGFHIDKNGNTYATSQGGDTHGNYGATGGADMFDLFSDRRSDEGRKSCTVDNNHDGAYSLVSSHYNNNMDKQRVQSVSMDSNGNNFYMAYYDALRDHICFRASTWGTNGPDTNNMFSSTENNYQAIAGSGVTKTGHTSAGGYVSIAVVPGNTDVVCAVWYDGTALKYAYISNPIGNINAIKTNKQAANWTGTKTIFASGGIDCQIKVDSDRGIHIAAQDSSGNVKYAYLSSYDASYSEALNSCFVDCGSVGSNLTLDVAKDGSNQVPFISYYSSETKKPKYAFRKTFTSLEDGMRNKKTYTEDWEVSYVPTSSRLIMDSAEKINVGVWKKDGALNWSTSDGKDPNGTGTNKGAVGNSYEKVTGATNSSTCISVTYGNGTKNGVLAYQIGYGGGSCLETAQKR